MAQIAEIVDIITPQQALPGENIIVDVKVKNIGASNYNIAVTGVYDSTNLSWQFDYLLLVPGETVTFRGWFTMPQETVILTIWSWYRMGTSWVLDETRTSSILILVYPAADIADLVVAISGGMVYPAADIADLAVAISGGLPPGSEIFANFVVKYTKG